MEFGVGLLFLVPLFPRLSQRHRPKELWTTTTMRDNKKLNHRSNIHAWFENLGLSTIPHIFRAPIPSFEDKSSNSNLRDVPRACFKMDPA
jgi:hypothetical protein